jgi:hypothetical protein
MANFIPSIEVDQVIDALSALISNFMRGGDVVRAQTNRVAMPSAPCAVLKELLQVDIHTPYTDYQPEDDTATIRGPQRIDVQIDFYGLVAGEICAVVKSALRTGWGFDQFPSNIKPLYTSDGMQAPLTTGEQQYESRWTLTASMQYNPITTIPQQFADDATVLVTAPADVFTEL